MTRRKYVLHEYSSERGRLDGAHSKSRQNLKDKSITTRVKVSKLFLYYIILIVFQAEYRVQQIEAEEKKSNNTFMHIGRQF